MSWPRAVERRGAVRIERAVGLSLDGFAWDSLKAAAHEEGLTVEQLITFAVLYYLADQDSGRIARRPSMGPYPGSSERAADRGD